MSNYNLKELSVITSDFNGPLEYLYQLVIEKKKNILEINILDVANAFVEYIRENINLMEIDIVTNSLSMVTHLIEIKSKKLLPVYENDKNLDEDLERDKFIQRILMYKKFKEVVPHLEQKFQERKLMSERQDFDEELFNNEVIEELPDFLPTNKLLKAMQNVFKEISDRRKFENIVNIGIKELSIDEITKQMLDIILANQSNNEITLKLLLSHVPSNVFTKQYFAVSFVSILVLTRNGLISLHQDLENDEDIYIKIIDLNLTYELDDFLEKKDKIEASLSEENNE